MGLYGALVIHPQSPTSLVSASLYSKDWAWMAADFYNTPYADLLAWYLSPASQGTEPQPDTIIVNGAFSNTSHFHVQSNDTLLLRLCSAAALDMVTFSIDGVVLSVIEIDGTEVRPFNVTSIMLNVAQRVTVAVSFAELRATYPNVSAIYARAVQMSDFDFSTQTFSPSYEPDYAPQPLWLGVIHIDAAPTDTSLPLYSPFGDPNTPETSLNYTFVDLNDLDARPVNWHSISYAYYGKDISGLQVPTPTASMPLVISFGTNDDGVNVAYFNNVSFSMPGMDMLMASDGTLPALYQQIVDAGRSIAVVPATPPAYIDSVNGNSSFYQVSGGAVVDVTLLNTDNGDHPFHLHGHHFWVVASSDYPTAEFDYHNAWLARDTVSVPASGFVVIRFIADNPNSWILHCHIDWHMAAGLGIIVLEATASLTPAYTKVPSAHLSICDAAVADQVVSAENAWAASTTTRNAPLSSTGGPAQYPFEPQGNSGQVTRSTALLSILAVVFPLLMGGLLAVSGGACC